ncbi:hypothetical protein QJS66_08645 [Kocuria rhizophila]|nr:hypothetical protein QJS66_08645 [Kocuria rhizophila]
MTTRRFRALGALGLARLSRPRPGRLRCRAGQLRGQQRTGVRLQGLHHLFRRRRLQGPLVQPELLRGPRRRRSTRH